MSLAQRKPQLPPLPTRARLELRKFESLPMAGFWVRYRALALDTLFLSIVGGVVSQILTLAFTKFVPLPTVPHLIIQIAGQLICTHFVYWKPMIQTGQSYGKKFMKIKIVDVNGDDLSPALIMRRDLLGKLASAMILGIGYLMAAGPQKLALHDRMYSSRVIRVLR